MKDKKLLAKFTEMMPEEPAIVLSELVLLLRTKNIVWATKSHRMIRINAAGTFVEVEYKQFNNSEWGFQIWGGNAVNIPLADPKCFNKIKAAILSHFIKWQEHVNAGTTDITATMSG